MRPRWYSIVTFFLSGLLILFYTWSTTGLISIPWLLADLMYLVGCIVWMFALLTYCRDIRPIHPKVSLVIRVFALIAGIGNGLTAISNIAFHLWRY